MVSQVLTLKTISRYPLSMTRRTFDQYCPIARALDVVGERWSLLIVRELVLGPKRYIDLRRTLPGMWTNLLADRLRQLESAGVIRRRELPPPAARTDERYALQVGDETLTAVVQRGRLEFQPGTPDAPAATLQADPQALLDVRTGRRSLTDALDNGLLEFEGQAAAVRRLRRAFALEPKPTRS